MNTIKKRTGSLTAKLAAALLAFAGVATAWGADPVTIQDADGNDISVYEVSSGFYQGAATYVSTADFYITSKSGFVFFRDMVSACDGGTAITTYVAGGFYLGQSVPGIYSNNIFNGKTVHLLCDINLENEDWTPISYPNQAFNNGGSKTQFYGNFDGHNHVVSNVKVVANSGNQTNPGKNWKNYGSYGLFGSLASNGATFRNLTVHNFTGVVGETVTSDPEIGVGDYVGAIVGNTGSNPVTFSNCKVTGLIKINGDYTGAICGIGNVNVVNCAVEGDEGSSISGNNFAGGLVGSERCSETSTLNIADNSVSGVAVSSSQFAGSVVGAMASGAAGTCTVSENVVISDVTVNGSAATTESFMASNSGATTVPVNVESENTISAPPVAKVTTGGVTTNYTDLHEALEAGKAAGSVVTLLTDVDLAGVAWTPVLDFAGTFDGNGKTISNLTVNTPDTDYVGLIGSTKGSGSSVKNVTLENATVTGRGMVGALIGQVASSSTVSGLVVKGLVKVSGNYKVGGIAGWGYVYFRGCRIAGDEGSFVKATYLGTKTQVANNPEENDYEGDNVGGIIGHLGEGGGLGLYDCSASGLTSTGTRKIGGMVGTFSHSSQISNAAVSDVTLGTTATLEYANANKSTMHLGGIVGSYFGSATTGTISGTVEDVTILVGEFAEGISFAAGNVNYGLVAGGSRVPADQNPETYVANWSGVIAKGYDAAKYSNDFLINNYVATVTDAEGNLVGGYETVDAALTAVKTRAGATVNIFAGEYTLTTANYTLAANVTVIGETDAATGTNLVTISGNPLFSSARGLSVRNVNFECDWQSGGTSMTVTAIPTLGPR